MIFNKKSASQGEILIYEDIGAGWFGGITAKMFADELKKLGPVDALDVRINSYGGEVFDGLAIYNTLVQHRAEVTVYVDGIAASIASVIAMAGKTINVAESATLMIHDAWGVAVGNAVDMRETAARLDQVTASIADVYAARTGGNLEQIRAWMAVDTWFTAAEAVDKGFATGTVASMKVAARFDPKKFASYRNVPASLTTAEPPPSPVASDVARKGVDEYRSRVRRQAAHLVAKGG